MICSECDAERNHHAMKIDCSVEDQTGDEAIYGGALQEAQCGYTELRPAES